MTKQSSDDVLELLIASDELLLEELFNHIQDYLIQKQASWIREDIFLVMKTTLNVANCQKLYEHCITTVCKNPQPFFTSKKFPSLGKDNLFNLLERYDLKIKEIVAWDYLIHWGIEQTPGLGNKNINRAKWNQENFEALKETLNHHSVCRNVSS